VDSPLRICQVAPLWARVPPADYGGAELIVHWLTEELVEMGHDVTLIASGNSVTKAVLLSPYPVDLLAAMRQGRAFRYEHYANSAWALAISCAHEFDVVHSHLGPTYLPLAASSVRPVLHTVHEGLDGPDELWLLDRFPDAEVVGISASQIARVPETRRRSMPVVQHGCDFAEYRFSPSTSGSLGFVGRMGPQKGPATAIRVALSLGCPIRLAGGPQNRNEEDYFEAEVRPLLRHPSVEYLGRVSHEEKVALLADTAVLLFPITWEEHFGVAMIEAMASGTPVVSFDVGSAPEVIDVGLTGYVGAVGSDLAGPTRMAMSLDRTRVRDRAYERFSRRRMATDYVSQYRRLTAAGQP
jgi:glycosyltransferase involved in cell wall biosynthesis